MNIDAAQGITTVVSGNAHRSDPVTAGLMVSPDAAQWVSVVDPVTSGFMAAADAGQWVS